MQVLHECLTEIFLNLTDTSLCNFNITLFDYVPRACFVTLLSYPCDIPEAKDVACVRHGLKGIHPCVRCKVTDSMFRECEQSGNRSVQELSRTRNLFRSFMSRSEMYSVSGDLSAASEFKKKGEDVLKQLSVWQWTSFLETTALLIPNCPCTLYSIFTFEPLHNLHLGVSKLIKGCIMDYLGADDIIAFPRGPSSKQKNLRSLRATCLKTCNTYLAAADKEYPMHGKRIDFSGGNTSNQLNGIFLSTGLRGMLEGKNYRNRDFDLSDSDVLSGNGFRA